MGFMRSAAPVHIAVLSVLFSLLFPNCYSQIGDDSLRNIFDKNR